MPKGTDEIFLQLKRLAAFVTLSLTIIPIVLCQNDTSDTQTKADFHYQKVKDWYRTNPDSTIVHALQSLDLYTRLRDTSKISRSINALTSSYYRLGDISTAAEYAQKGYQIVGVFSKASSRQRMTSLNNMAVMLQESGNSVEAIKQLDDVLKSVNNSNISQQSVAIIHQNIGNNYSIIGEYNRAQHHLLKALELIEDSTYFAPIVLSISSNAIRKGNYGYATTILDRLTTAPISDYHEIIYLRLRAIISLFLQEYSETDSILISLLPKISNENYIAKALTLINLGKSKLQQNNPQIALDYFLKADSFIISNPRSTKVVYHIEALKGIAIAYGNLEKNDLAEEYWSKAFTSNRESGSPDAGISRHDLEWQLLLAKVQESRDLKPKEKCSLLEKAIKHLLLSRMHLSTNESRMLHTTDSRLLFDLYIDILYERLKKGEDVFNKMIHITQIAHKITLQENITAFEKLDVNPSLKKQFIQIQSQIKNIQRKHPQLMNPQEMENAPSEKRDSLQSLVELKNSIEDSLLSKSMIPSFSLDHSKSSSVQFIVFHETEDHIYVMDNSSRDNVNQIPRAVVRNQLKRLQNAWHNPDGQDSSTYILSMLSNRVLPHIEEFSSNTIYAILDGLMSSWPLEVFPCTTLDSSQSSTIFLGEKYQFEYVNQLSSRIGTQDGKSLLSIAPQNFTEGMKCNGNILPHLKCNLQEAQHALSYFDGMLMSDTTLSVEAILKSIREHDVIHLSTHICLDTSSWFKTQILLNNNSLNGSDLFKVDWSGKSVILSTCSSGQGQLVKGEGIISFSRWLLELGCSEILVAQWPIDDCITSEIMSFVFEEWQKTENLSAALFAARNRFIKSAPDHLRTPQIWGAFVVVKNSPLYSKSKNEWYLLIGSAIGASLLLLGMAKLIRRDQ